MILREKMNDIFFLLLSRSFINKIFIFPIVCLYLVGFCSYAFPSFRDERNCEPPPWHNHPQLIKKLDVYDALSTTLKSGVYTAEGYIYFYADQIEVRSCLGLLFVEPIFVNEDGSFIEIIFDDGFREVLEKCTNSPLEFGYHNFIPIRKSNSQFNYKIVKTRPFITYALPPTKGNSQNYYKTARSVLLDDNEEDKTAPPFSLENLTHHPITNCRVNLKGHFVRDSNPIYPPFKSIFKPKEPPKKMRMALKLMDISIKE